MYLASCKAFLSPQDKYANTSVIVTLNQVNSYDKLHFLFFLIGYQAWYNGVTKKKKSLATESREILSTL